MKESTFAGVGGLKIFSRSWQPGGKTRGVVVIVPGFNSHSLKLGDQWLHLRLCVTCGHVGCCDDSKNQHAAKHFHSTNHPLIKSFETDEEWGWCYIDELLLESVPGSLTEEWCGVLGATP
ncbi:MAG TPA: UBP-type zinc finger domain-containing protein [Pyrinomonadaceae bacterium]|nr:UBP-type zinc finger domain-containing protein [Pyrinomonadaceae bacterium]